MIGNIAALGSLDAVPARQQGAGQSRPVIRVKVTDPVHNIAEDLFCHFLIRELNFLVSKSRCRNPAQIKDDLDQISVFILLCDRLTDLLRQNFQEGI